MVEGIPRELAQWSRSPCDATPGATDGADWGALGVRPGAVVMLVETHGGEAAADSPQVPLPAPSRSPHLTRVVLLPATIQ